MQQDGSFKELLGKLQRRTLETVEEMLLEAELYEDLLMEAHERSAKALIASPLLGLPVPLFLGFFKAGFILSAMSYPLATGALLLYALSRRSDSDTFRGAGEGEGRELLVRRLQAMKLNLERVLDP